MEIIDFHAHIYFEHTDTRWAVSIFRRTMAQLFPDAHYGDLHFGPIGPHTKPMFSVVMGPKYFGQIVPWLMLHRGTFNVLVHPSTGNSLLDHTEHALWLGDKIPLDLDKL